MAGLPPDGTWLVQQADGIVRVFNRYTEMEVVSFQAGNADEASRAQKVIDDSDDLDSEQKCFAHFWCGYFYAHAAANEL
jgi:hypothetical protein